MSHKAILAICLFTILLSACAKPQAMGTRYPYSARSSVYYSGEATEQDAKALGDALEIAGYPLDQGATVAISKAGDGTTISFVVTDGVWDNAEVVATFTNLARDAVFASGGTPSKVRFLDDRNILRKEMAIQDIGKRLPVGTHDEIYYSPAATEQDAKSLGKALKDAGYFTDSGLMVMLSKTSDGPVISFMVKQGAWNDATLVEEFKKYTINVAPAVGGPPIKLRLVTRDMQVQKEVPVAK